MIAKPFPRLSLVCLQSAENVDALDIVNGRDTIVGELKVGEQTHVLQIARLTIIVDFWTTSCERCPGGLDKLDIIAEDPSYSNISFVSICCDKLDGAREIIEREEDPRWSNVSHYFLSPNDKEKAKSWLGFSCVPFYVAINKEGKICDSGGAETFNLHQAILFMQHKRFLNVEHRTHLEGAPSDHKAEERIRLERSFVLDASF